eukprot:4647835-Amphidinium_carterae.1
MIVPPRRTANYLHTPQQGANDSMFLLRECLRWACFVGDLSFLCGEPVESMPTSEVWKLTNTVATEMITIAIPN